ncbi:Kinesin-like protein KIN-7K [Diplonema papillatum]|nr:Kinesin-like protein KIN-7K [Diplonema papillatum]
MNVRRLVTSGCLLLIWVVIAVLLFFIPAKKRFDIYQQALCEVQDIAVSTKKCANATSAAPELFSAGEPTAPNLTTSDGVNSQCCNVSYQIVIESMNGKFLGYPDKTFSSECQGCSLACVSNVLNGLTDGSKVTCWYDPETNSLLFNRTIPVSAIACLTIPTTFLIVWLVVAVSRGCRGGDSEGFGYTRLPTNPVVNERSSAPPALEKGVLENGEDQEAFAVVVDDDEEVSRVRLFNAGTPHGEHCGICMVAKREIVFSPCGHYCCCNGCSLQFVSCPICRTRVASRIIVSEDPAAAAAILDASDTPSLDSQSFRGSEDGDVKTTS